ncbi:hypothetical protein SLEP1_g60341 [Rubroshorea leprosula]|uniref:Secreted protein n=2 Tax=Rubroshorea leprosula TaxID=152421 RepID=A0AAV5MYA9_9ROSI|nr:hypothetical protein SLEP1_g60341 [Rubroshorea leprosula]
MTLCFIVRRSGISVIFGVHSNVQFGICTHHKIFPTWGHSAQGLTVPPHVPYLDKPPEASQKPHFVFLCLPLPSTSFLPLFSNQD